MGSFGTEVKEVVIGSKIIHSQEEDWKYETSEGSLA
jgi:hypothetical protein